jgi:hypothetical protein
MYVCMYRPYLPIRKVYKVYICISFMGVKTIYLPDELIEKLREENNASGLIANLLKDHYGDGKTPEEVIAEVKNIIEDKKSLVSWLNGFRKQFSSEQVMLDFVFDPSTSQGLKDKVQNALNLEKGGEADDLSAPSN